VLFAKQNGEVHQIFHLVHNNFFLNYSIISFTVAFFILILISYVCVYEKQSCGGSNKIQRVYNAINYNIHFHLPIRVANNWCSHDAILASIGHWETDCV
jgi:hypothetical protein